MEEARGTFQRFNWYYLGTLKVLGRKVLGRKVLGMKVLGWKVLCRKVLGGC